MWVMYSGQWSGSGSRNRSSPLLGPSKGLQGLSLSRLAGTNAIGLGGWCWGIWLRTSYRKCRAARFSVLMRLVRLVCLSCTNGLLKESALYVFFIKHIMASHVWEGAERSHAEILEIYITKISVNKWGCNLKNKSPKFPRTCLTCSVCFFTLQLGHKTNVTNK